MHPTLPRTVPAPATRNTRPAAAHRALPARRVPRAVELGDAESGAVLTSLLAGLRAVPDKPAVDVRTRVLDALRAVWQRIDFDGLALVAKAGVGASLVFTVVLLLWLASAGRLG